MKLGKMQKNIVDILKGNAAMKSKMIHEKLYCRKWDGKYESIREKKRIVESLARLRKRGIVGLYRNKYWGVK